MLDKDYIHRIKKRSILHFIIGFFPRFYNYYLNEIIRKIAITKGAKIGNKSSIPFSLAFKANKNLKVGDNTIIETSFLDLREKLYIGDNVIINRNVEIIRQSHDINSENFLTTGNSLIIEDFAWITTKVIILPNCCFIGKGSVISAGSILVKDVPPMQVFGGSPASYIKDRNVLPVKLDNSSLQGRDIKEYWKARFVR